MAESSLAGPERAAVLLLSLGEDAAAQILKHMGPKQVQVLGEAMAEIQKVSQSQIDGVVEEFLGEVGQVSGLGVDSHAYVRKVMMDALGDDKASALLDRIMVGGQGSDGLESLKWMDSKAIADLIGNEHPQVIAIVLSYLESDQAAKVLALLAPEARAGLLLRMSSLETIQPAALQELSAMLEQQMQGSSVQGASFGGVKVVADILNFVDSTIEGEIMEVINEKDAELGQQIQDLMFVFDNLGSLDDTAIQALLREVSSESLILALKGASESMREKFFSNMSKRAGEMMRDDLESKGPVKVSEVEVAQKEIVATARRMADEGTIVLGGQGGDDFI